MFQKSCLFKCIKSNPSEVSLIEQNYGLFKYNDNLTISLSNKSKSSSKDKTQVTSIQSLKRRINNSFKQKTRPIKILQFIRNDKFDVDSSIKTKSNSNVLSSTMITNNSMQSSRLKQFEKEFYTEYSDSSDEEYDNDDSDASINFGINNTLRNDDLNSSLSSVSSLEFEPFETSNQSQRQKSYSKKVMRPKFDPLISSSRSALITNNSKSIQASRRSVESTKKLNFEPFTMSSRKSLLLNNSNGNDEISLNHCPICDIDYDLKRECLTCQHNYSISSSRFFVEENICSSTVISINKRNSTFNKNQSDTSSLIKKSFSSSSSSSSSSSLSSTKFSDEISCIQANQPKYYILNDTYV